MKAVALIGVFLTVAACSHSQRAAVIADDYVTDSTCHFVRVPAHPDAEKLVAEFVKRDAEGRTLSYEPWADTAIGCPGHVPGPDAFTVVKAYRIWNSASHGDSAAFDVEYARLGTASYGPDGERIIVPDVRPETLHYVLLRTAFGWRVNSPTIPQRVLLDSAKPLFPPEQVRKLDSLAARVR